ncbi:MAG: alpha-L-rhamnosidase [Ruminococcaceae bacterium]|nr:alpha-L-rhamnosidase [Oscillospiraceae bacterium]
MDITKGLNPAKIDGTDPRKRRYLLPKEIKRVFGEVENSDSLLSDRPCQISFSQNGEIIMKNSKGGENAAILLDFGAELAGSLRLIVHSVRSEGKRADLRIRLGESVSEAITPIGEKNTTNDHANRDYLMNVGFYSANETPESGFRFAYIELLGENVTLTLKSVFAVFRYRDLPYLGSFRCSDELLNRIYDTAVRTVHLCMQEYLWDGIKRDRLVWIGDMHTEVKTILSVFGNCDIIRRSLDLIRNDTPSDQWMNNISSYSLWWIIIHAELYRTYGDLTYLSEQRDYLTALVSRSLSFVGEDGAEELPESRFLDWQNKGHEEATHAGLQGLLKYALTESAYLLEALGEAESAESARLGAERMKRHIPSPAGSKQAAAMLSISGIADPKEINGSVLSQGGAKGYSTFFGYYILTAKALAGDLCGALDDIKDYWGGMLSMGATSFWEDFDLDWVENSTRIDEFPEEGKRDIHGDFGAFCYKNFRHSLCHGWASGPCPYLVEQVLGIRALAPDTYEVKPCLAYLDFAEGEYPTALGTIKVSAKKEGERTVTEISAPEGIKIVK